MPALSANHQLIRVDLLDQGQTDKAADIPYTQMTQADLIIALLDILSCTRRNLVGISYGGEVAIQLAIAYPQRVDRLCCSIPPPIHHLAGPYRTFMECGGRTRDGAAYYKQLSR